MTKKAYLITEINQTFTPLQRLVTFVLLLGQAKIKEGTTFSGRIFYYTEKQGASLKVRKKCWGPREGRMEIFKYGNIPQNGISKNSNSSFFMRVIRRLLNLAYL